MKQPGDNEMTDIPETVPDFWAVHSGNGSHIGLWPSEGMALDAAREYDGSVVTPLYRASRALPHGDTAVGHIAAAFKHFTDARRDLTLGRFSEWIWQHRVELGGDGFVASIGEAISSNLMVAPSVEREAVPAFERELHDGIIGRLVRLTVGSCSCDTKSPELKYHSEDCRYRIASEALELARPLYILVAPKREAVDADLVRRLTSAIDLGRSVGAMGDHPTNIYRLAQEALVALSSRGAE